MTPPETLAGTDDLLGELDAERASRRAAEDAWARDRTRLDLISSVAIAARSERTLFGLSRVVGDVVARHTKWRLEGVLVADEDGDFKPTGGETLIPIRVGGVVKVALEFRPPQGGTTRVDLADVADAVEAELSHAAERIALELRLRDAEERHRTLVEQLPLATYADRPDTLTGAAYVSPQIEVLTGYPADEWLANPDLFPGILHPEDRDRTLSAITRLKSGDVDRLEQEYRLLHRDGRTVWVHDVAVNVRGVDGRVKYTQGYVHDVTARKERDELLSGENERLREVERVKDDLVSLVSHELRTPLTSVLGYLELALEDCPVEEADVVGYLEVAKRNGERLRRLVGDLLLCAQVDAGRFTVLSEPVDLSSVLADAIGAARPAADARGVSLEAEPASLPAVLGDAARLAQVLDNLISNGIKFTRPGGKVSVGARAEAEHVRITVRDTGMGIPAGEQHALFARFFRTSLATEQAIAGTGLGLSITKSIVDAHNGCLRFTSTEGVGTTFEFTLPLARA